jgi:hypothetical protein
VLNATRGAKLPLFFIFSNFAYKAITLSLFVACGVFVEVVFVYTFPLTGINVLNAPTTIILFCAEIFDVNIVKNTMFFV